MYSDRQIWVATAVLLAGLATACGKKGPVRPPPSKVSAPIADLTGVQLGPEVALRMTYPVATIGGLPLEGVESLEVWKIDIPYFVAQEVEDPDAEEGEGAIDPETGEPRESDDSSLDDLDGDEQQQDDDFARDATDEDRTNDDNLDERDRDDRDRDDRERGDRDGERRDRDDRDREDREREEQERDPIPTVDPLTFESGGEMILELRDADLNAVVVGTEIVMSFPLPEPEPFEEEELEEEALEEEEEPEDGAEAEPRLDPETGEPLDGVDGEPEIEILPPIRKVVTIFGVRTRAPKRRPSPFSNFVRIVFLPPPDPPEEVRLEGSERSVIVSWEADLPVVVRPTTGEEGGLEDAAADPTSAETTEASPVGPDATDQVEDPAVADPAVVEQTEPAEAATEPAPPAEPEVAETTPDAATADPEAEPELGDASEPAEGEGEEEDDGKLVGFNVYRRLVGNSDYGAPVGRVRTMSTTYSDSTAEYGSRYEYTVTTVFKGQTEVESALAVSAEIEYLDVFAPATPRGLVVLTEADRVRLLWDRVTATDLDGYLVYRASGDGEPVALTDEPLVALDYSDDTVEAGQTYSYTITAIDSEGNESEPSEAQTATTR